MNITKTITHLTCAAACLLGLASSVNAQALDTSPAQPLFRAASLPSSGMQAGRTSPWTDLGGGTAGVAGQPLLTGTGPLVDGTQTTFRLENAPPDARMLIWVSFDPAPFSALGGTVHAFPFTLQLSVAADATGVFAAQVTWPAVAPQQIWIQAIVRDMSVPQRLILSNGLLASF